MNTNDRSIAVPSSRARWPPAWPTQRSRSRAAVAQAAPIRLGFLTVKTGPLASGGIQMEQGAHAFFKERNNTIAGRTGRVASPPTPAATRRRRAPRRRNWSSATSLDVIIGPLAAFEPLAIDDYIRSSQTPILTVAGAEDMTQRKANP